MIDSQPLVELKSQFRKKALMTVAAFAVVLVATMRLFSAMYNPVAVESEMLVTQNAGLKHLIGQRGNQSTSLARTIPARVFKVQPSSHWINWLEEITASFGCSMTSLTPEASSDSLVLSSWDLGIAGNYNCVGMLAQNLEQSASIVEITSLTIQPASANTYLDALVTFNVWLADE